VREEPEVVARREEEGWERGWAAEIPAAEWAGENAE
jgi:hypothetical protein